MKVKRIRDRKYLDWLKTLDCVNCLNSPCDPAHIIDGRYSMGMKSGDDTALCLCRSCHIIQGKSEKKFWGDIQAAKDFAAYLYSIKFKTEQALHAIHEFQSQRGPVVS